LISRDKFQDKPSVIANKSNMRSEQKKKEPEVSVIIPTYNRGWILQEAIDSVLAQTFNAYEVIVVDDGSEDNTAEILKNYSNIIRIIHQENKGVSAARNLGIKSSSGRFIALLDSDDLWLPEKLERQTSFFRKNSGAMICQTQEIWIRKGKRVNPCKHHKKISGMIFEPSLSLCLVSPSAVMFKRELLETVGFFDESLYACEDYDLWLRVSLKFPVYLIDEALIIKRGGHDDQLSRSPMLDKYRIEAIKKLLIQNILTSEQRLAALMKFKEKCIIYAKGCKKRGRHDEANEIMKLVGKV
jgi:glycosyltransferase involved in cell wall biosynthesis